ncbi:hypothetical protein TNIN_279951 [Trichonephila inaurata madagascariensis]|uniref:Uncharacterized protein n=1 Tax=Trichonephila inaurata madagascariensis TaxID=2747483 RepID=A0A8X7BWC1_9ARAC|nr:hypothetical protein TNIN_279951 [Trichonephila inaurata madagascariensis]
MIQKTIQFLSFTILIFLPVTKVFSFEMYPRRVPKSLSPSENSQVGSTFEDYVLTEAELSFGNVYITPTVSEAKEDETLIGDKAMEDTTQIGDKTTEDTALIGYKDTEDATWVGEKVTEKPNLILTFSETVAEAESITHTVDTDIKVVGTEGLTTWTETTESLNQETSKFIKTESTVTLDSEVQQTKSPKRINELDALNDDYNIQGIFSYTDKFGSPENDKQLDITVAETDEKRQDESILDVEFSRTLGQSNKTEFETFGLSTKAEKLTKNRPKAERSSKDGTETERFRFPEDRTDDESFELPEDRTEVEQFRHPEDRIEAEGLSKNRTEAERFRLPEDRTEAERFRRPEDKREAEIFRLPKAERPPTNGTEAERPFTNRTEAERFELPKNRTEAETLPKKKLETENLKYSESQKLSKGQWEEGKISSLFLS